LLKKLLVCGISGLTGYKIAKLASNFDVTGVYNTRPVNLECKTIQANLVDFEKTSDIFSEIKPDIVINTTALHNVDYCEEHPDESSKINTTLVKNLSDNCKKIGAKFVHTSTDYVFDGKNKTPYSENDLAIPLSQYGKSKLEGEESLQDSDNLIIRPSVVYGWTPMELAGVTSSSGKPMNFAMWLLKSLHEKKPLKIVTDQFTTATLADSLAESILKMSQTTKSGLYHVAGLSCESRYDFSIKFAKEFGYDPNTIESTNSTAFKQKAQRPSFSCLNSAKAITEFDLDLYDTNKSLQIMKSQVKQDAPELLGNN
jgi:dTDP-4-dehydrorhamnose reductase